MKTKEKAATEKTVICFCLFVCLFAACFFPPVKGFSGIWLRPKWLLSEVVGLLLILTFGIYVLVTCRHQYFNLKSFLKEFRIEYVFCQTLLLVSFIEAMYAIGKMFRNGRYMAASGTFDNPAGLAFCLCISFPFYIFLWQKYANDRIIRISIFLCGTITVVAILCTGSRTGWICLGGYIVLWLQKQWKRNYMVSSFCLALLVIGLTLSVISFKTDSTRGRFFILERSWELIQTRPLKGYGSGGFIREYMLRQAEFFKQHPDSEYAWLASEVYHPLNEFLWVWIEYGLIGVLLLLTIVMWLIVKLSRQQNAFSVALATSLCIWCVFALFSYPLKYPLTTVIGIATMGYVYIRTINKDYINTRYLHGIGMIGIIFAFVGLARMAHSYVNEYKWSQAMQNALHGQSKEMMTRYAKLYKYYRCNASFLYNYAAEQFYAGFYEDALITAKECRTFWPSYNLALLTGDICRAANKNEEAVQYYEQAYWMCPVRFAPLEGLYYAYKHENNPALADSIAALIAKKKVKVDSPDVRRIKREIQEDVCKMKNP